MKNILIVSDTFKKGGLESRVTEAIAYYRKHNYKVFLASISFNNAYKELFDKIIQLDTPGNTISSILSTKEQIIKFCVANKIDFIECHPFILSLPTALAASELKIPTTYTLHGLTSGDFVSNDQIELKKLYYLALRYGFDQIFAVAEYLNDIYSYLSPNIKIARNGTLFSGANIKQSTSPTGKIAIASRLDVPKTKLIIDFLKTIETIPEIKQVDIYGEGDSKDKLEEYIKTNSKIKLCGWANDLTNQLKNNKYSVAFGMGRVIFDIIKAGIPAGILGYGGFIDIINNHNINKYAKTNLTSWETISDIQKHEIIKDALVSPKKYILSVNSLRMFDCKKIWNEYLSQEEKIIFEPKPVLDELNLILQAYVDLDPALTQFDKDFDASFDPVYYSLMGISQQKSIILENEKEISVLKNQLNDILNSRFWRKTEKPRKLLHKVLAHNNAAATQPTSVEPEIIAVLCVYNEELNIEGCLTHLSDYVDKIIIFDDKSTDNTIQLAKKYPKVVKIIKNNCKSKWDERKNRELVLKAAYQISNRQNPWVLCVDADERLEINFLKNIRNIIKEHAPTQTAVALHFRELWDNTHQYRDDGVWGEKQKTILFPLKEKMTFNFKQEHHIPWIYQELEGNEKLSDYSIYHLKMVKPKDRAERAKLYNTLDPQKKMQPIGYDYLTDETNISLKQIPADQDFDHSTVPKYYY